MQSSSIDSSGNPCFPHRISPLVPEQVGFPMLPQSMPSSNVAMYAIMPHPTMPVSLHYPQPPFSPTSSFHTTMFPCSFLYAYSVPSLFPRDYYRHLTTPASGLSGTILPYLSNFYGPSTCENFSPFPHLTQQHRSTQSYIPLYQSQNPISIPTSDICTVFGNYNPSHMQLQSHAEDCAQEAMKSRNCAACGRPAPCTVCPKCHLVYYCSLTTCYKQDVDHQTACAEYSDLSSVIHSQPCNHIMRMRLIKILEYFYKRQAAKLLMDWAIWHSNEIMRLSQNKDPVNVHLEMPFYFLCIGRSDSVVSFVRFWARKSNRSFCSLPDSVISADPILTFVPGYETYPCDINRLDDALAEGFPLQIIPLKHLVALCVVKAQVIASFKARERNAEGEENEESDDSSDDSENLSTGAEDRLENFLLKSDSPYFLELIQVSMFERYLGLIGRINPIMEHMIRNAPFPESGCTAAHKEAQEIWNSYGEMFLKILH